MATYAEATSLGFGNEGELSHRDEKRDELRRILERSKIGGMSLLEHALEGDGIVQDTRIGEEAEIKL